MNLSKQTKRREKKRMMSMLLAMLMLFSGIFGMLPGSGAMKAYAADVSENEVSENVISENEVYENAATENEISENDITEPDLSENTVSENDSSEGYVIMEPDDDLEEVVAVTEPEDVHYEGEGFRVDFVIQSSWENHYNAVITVTNTSDETLHNWGLSFESTDSVSGLYNATEPDGESEIRLFKNAGWNQDIPAGGTVFFGYTASYEGNPDVPREFSIASVEKVVSSERYEVSCVLYEEWESGGLVQLIIENISDTTIEDWRIEFDSAMNISEIWDGVIISHEGQHYQLQNADYAQNIAPGESHIVSMIIEGELGEEPLTNLTAGEVVVETDAMGEDENEGANGDADEDGDEENTPDVTEDIRVMNTTGEGLEDIGEVYFKEVTSMEDIVYTEDRLSCVRNQFLLTAREGVSYEEVEALVEAQNARIVGYIELTNDYQVEYNCDISPDAIEDNLAIFQASEIIEMATLNYIAYEESQFHTNDTEYPHEWDCEEPRLYLGIEAIDMTGALIHAGVISSASANHTDVTTEHIHTVRMGIIDNCFEVQQADLRDNFVYAWNNYETLEEIQNATIEKSYHGTHVAGIMAAGFNNNEGITGVCIQNELYGFAMDANRAPSVEGWNAIFKLKCALALLIGNNVKVINYSKGYSDMSFGASQGESSAIAFLEENTAIIDAFLQKLVDMGYDFLIVAAAGNYNSETYYRYEGSTAGYIECEIVNNDMTSYPTVNVNISYGAPNSSATNIVNEVEARYCTLFAYSESMQDRIICVGAAWLNNRGTFAEDFIVTSYSNVGDRVDILAPGINIVSCVISTSENSANYERKNGTSMAAPFVSGTIGLIYNVAPNLSATEIKEIVTGYTTDLLNEDVDMLNAAKVIEEVQNRYGESEGENPDIENGILVGDVIAAELLGENSDFTISENGVLIYSDGTIVQDSAWEGMNGAEIRARGVGTGPENAGVVIDMAVSDEDGHFVMMLPEGRYQLRIEKDGYFVRTLYCEVVSGEANFLGVIAMQKENEVLCTINISLDRAEEDMQLAHPNVPNSEGDYEVLFLYHIGENGRAYFPLVTCGPQTYEDDGILYADFRVGEYEENGEWTVSIYESMLTSQYAELIIFEAPNSNPDDVVLLENAQITVTMADGTVYEMSFPEGNRGSSWSIFRIENGNFSVLNIVEEELMIHRE